MTTEVGVVLIVSVVGGAVALVAGTLFWSFWLTKKQDRLREEKRRLQWMSDFQGRRDARAQRHDLDAINYHLEGHRFADQFTPPPLRKGGINDAASAPKPPPPPPGRVVRDSLFPSFGYRAGLDRLHKATDAPARRSRRRTP